MRAENARFLRRRLLSQPHLPGAHVSEVGEMLRSARQQQRLSVLQVAEAIKIKPQYLEALEEGDYHLLPGQAYVTGFLKNYAKYLGLHPEDVMQDFHTIRPEPQPDVKAATRVLASGYQRQHRKRLISSLVAVVVLLIAGYCIRQYNENYAHASSPQLNMTPANLGGGTVKQPKHAVAAATQFRIRLHAVAPVWARVTVDGVRRFQGIMRNQPAQQWAAHHSIFVVTYDGAHIKALYNNQPSGLLAHQPGLVVWVANASGWHQAS